VEKRREVSVRWRRGGSGWGGAEGGQEGTTRKKGGIREGGRGGGGMGVKAEGDEGDEGGIGGISGGAGESMRGGREKRKGGRRDPDR